MQAEPTAKQQIVERIKSSTNILVTVGSNPSVDALSAALSLTLMLNRLDKHATAVFSGQVPPAINFLEPSKTFENTVDSLRDFIIALDKEKADRLRYKVENDVVRIFITPYRTVITDKDLKFSQGDFNVELIIALGVEKREDLDAAVTAHGRILHDATVVTVNANGGKSTLGSVDWSEPAASSLCEMLMSLSEALQSGLLDEQIATAVLTGIVSATDRFRNEHTSPRVMTMAAQLMAAGANQQLIAAKLEEGHVLPEPSKDGSTKLDEGKSQKVASKPKTETGDDGALEIAHIPEADAAPVPDRAAEALKEAESELAESLERSSVPVAPTLSVEDLKNDLAAAADEVEVASQAPVITEATPQIIKQDHRNWRTEPTEKPSFGGTLNATVSEAEEAKREEEIARASQQLLSHDEPTAAPAEPPTFELPPEAEPAPVSLPPLPSFELPPEEPTPPLRSTSDEALSFEETPLDTPPIPSLAEIDDQTRGKAEDDARAAIDAALSAMPFNPAGKPAESAGAAPILEVAHEEPAPAESSAPEVASSSLPPLPDFSTLPPLPGDEPLQPVPPASPVQVETTQIPNTPIIDIQPPATQAAPPDPGQFKIPGQS